MTATDTEPTGSRGVMYSNVPNIRRRRYQGLLILTLRHINIVFTALTRTSPSFHHSIPQDMNKIDNQAAAAAVL